MSLSARSLGVLFLMVRESPSASAETLSEFVLEGRAAILTAMKELEAAGLIERGTNRINGRILAYTRVTDAGVQLIEGGSPQVGYRTTVSAPDTLYSEQYQQYKQQQVVNNTTDTQFLLVKIPETSSGEGEGMPYEFFGPTSDSSDDQVRERTKWQKQKREDAREKTKRLTMDQLPPGRLVMLQCCGLFLSTDVSSLGN